MDRRISPRLPRRSAKGRMHFDWIGAGGPAHRLTPGLRTSMHESDEHRLSRRDFIGAGATAAAAVHLLPGAVPPFESDSADRMIGVPFTPRTVARVGLIG
ncbi:MAG: twin-arginine translocation signal domain-containing protein, partial [Gemmatimonadales bacterium]